MNNKIEDYKKYYLIFSDDEGDYGDQVIVLWGKSRMDLLASLNDYMGLEEGVEEEELEWGSQDDRKSFLQNRCRLIEGVELSPLQLLDK